jgi:hypothetical protein
MGGGTELLAPPSYLELSLWRSFIEETITPHTKERVGLGGLPKDWRGIRGKVPLSRKLNVLDI